MFVCLCVRPSITKLPGAITSDFMHRFTQYLIDPVMHTTIALDEFEDE